MVSTLITNVVTAYLYGPSLPTNLVNDNLIRSDSTTPTVSVSINASTYMTQSAGRFAKSSQFVVVQKFFATDTTLSAGSYTLSQILTKLGLSDTAAIANNFENIIGSKQADNIIFCIVFPLFSAMLKKN